MSETQWPDGWSIESHRNVHGISYVLKLLIGGQLDVPDVEYVLVNPALDARHKVRLDGRQSPEDLRAYVVAFDAATRAAKA